MKNEHIEPLESPINAVDRFLHAVAIRQEATNRRLDAIIGILTTLVEKEAIREDIAVENVTVEEIIPDAKPKRKKK